MITPTIFRGHGGNFAPYAPRLDALMGKRMQARGLAGTRDASKSVFGSICKDQALAYAQNEDEEHLLTLEPLPGSVLSYARNVIDLQLSFGEHLRDMHSAGIYSYKGYSFQGLAHDLQGDMDLAEVYLSLGRQKRAISAMIDRYLDTLDVREHQVADANDFSDFLEDHNGEVWITGPCRTSKFVSCTDLPGPAGVSP